MREIKFRCMYTDGSNWISRDFTIDQISNADHYDYICDDAIIRKYKLDCYRQLTGLKDKNGVEIYEGDIVRQYWIEESRYESGEYIYGVIEFNVESAGFFERYECNLEKINIADAIVIGNIYEHKHLLEKNND